MGRQAQDVSQVNFRMPAELKLLLERSAREENRSLTAEIVTRLYDSYNAVGLPADVLGQLKMAAKRNGHSVAEEIGAMMDRPPPPNMPQNFEDTIAELRASQARIESLATTKFFHEVMDRFEAAGADEVARNKLADALVDVPFTAGFMKDRAIRKQTGTEAEVKAWVHETMKRPAPAAKPKLRLKSRAKPVDDTN